MAVVVTCLGRQKTWLRHCLRVVKKEGAKHNIWACEGGGDRRLDRTV